MFSLYQNIKAVCKIKAILISALEQQAGLGQNTIFTWDKTVLSTHKVLRVAKYLYILTDSLLGNPIPSHDKTLADFETTTIQVVTET